MLRSLPELCIVNPHGLYAGSECLTYDSKGYTFTLLAIVLIIVKLRSQFENLSICPCHV